MANKEKNQFAVIGLGQFGCALATSLYGLGKDVLVIDKNEQLINSIADKVTHAVIADAADENVLKNVGIKNFDVVCVCMSSDMDASILVTLMTKELGVPYVVSKASTERHKQVLEKIGADRIVFPEESVGKRIANELVNPTFSNLVDVSARFKIVELAVPKSWVGKKLTDMDLRGEFQISIIVIKRNDDIVNPSASTEFSENDVLVIGGNVDGIAKLSKRI